jgi:hypothetical protein
MRSRMTAAITTGTRVRLVDAYLDDQLTRPVIGTVEGIFYRPDWGEDAYVVVFDHDEPKAPPSGEFPARNLRSVDK